MLPVYGRITTWRVRAREPGLSLLLILELIVIFVVIPLKGIALYRFGGFEVLATSFVVVLAIAAITPSNNALAAMIVTALLTLASDYFRYVSPSIANELLFLFASLMFLATLTAIVGSIVFGPGRVTIHRIQGAIVFYLNLAILFVYPYAIILLFSPGAFGELAATDPAVGSKLAYFSFTTLATVGYGDIVPMHPLARSLANLEGLMGQLYPATLLARIVTLEIDSRRK